MSNDFSEVTDYLVELWSNVPDDVDLTLVGGGALFYWSSIYYQLFPDFFSDEPLGTKDIDFVASSDAAKKCHQHWGGNLIIPSRYDATPEVAILEIKAGETDSIHIDFLYDLIGVKKQKIEKERIFLEEEGFYVLTEFMLLMSRVANTIRLPQYRSPHALGQLRQSIAVVKAAIKTRLDTGDVNEATSLAHKLLELAKSPMGVQLFVKYEVDLLEGWVESEDYLQPFLEHAKPKLWPVIEKKRISLKERQKS